jgi:hypothetical protein
MKPVPLNGNGATAPIVDMTFAPFETVLAYLLDWSFVDDDGKPVVIRGQPIEVVANYLDALDVTSFAEILEAVQRHDNDNTREREANKASPFGETESSSTSTSVA